MNVSKLISRRRADSYHSGPMCEITLGLIVDGRSIILGSFYEGPHMDSSNAAITDRVTLELFIDKTVALFAKDGP